MSDGRTVVRSDGKALLRRLIVLSASAMLVVLLPAVRLSAQSDSLRARALALLKTAPLIDGHNDLADAIRERGGLDSVDVAVPQPKLMTDIPRLRRGAVGAQFWAAYVPGSSR